MDANSSPTFACELYDPSKCDPAKAPCVQVEQCKENKGMQLACYAVWANDTINGMKLSLKGCWLAQNAEHNNCNQEKCTAERATVNKVMHGDHEENTYFCCCNKPMCNERFEYVPPVSKVESTVGKGTTPVTGGYGTVSALAALLPVLFAAVLIFAAYYAYRRYKLRKETKRMISLQENGLLKRPSSPMGPLKPVQLIEEIAKGRYGRVFKGSMGENQFVAVKVFPVQDVDSWSIEQEIYAVPGLKNHPNILRFLGSEVRGFGLKAEYWLVSTLQEHGSLHDYLKKHTVTLPEFFRIAVGMLRGLSFLHEETLSDSETSYKAAIVHRDVKSRNVLLSKDLTACISDFGLAIKCVQGRTPGDVHAQVGTRRYMSPEVLEGATDFNAFAFRQIDVYAAGLVVWEIISRCTFVEEVGDYKLPFEDVGMKPSLQDLQEYVVVKKKRPAIKETWKKHQQGAVICSTIEEMWDMEPEARITAGCALARLSALQSNVQDSSKCVPPVCATLENETKPQEEKSPLILDSVLSMDLKTSDV